MKCPICKTIDQSNLHIERNPEKDNDYHYIYCLLSCDSYTLTEDAFIEMKKQSFSKLEQEKLVEIALNRVISKEDVLKLEHAFS